MNKLSGGKNSAVLLVLALAVAILFAVYYYLVMPKMDEASAKQNSVNAIQSEITTLQGQIAQVQSEQSETVVDEYALRKKVPNNRDVDALLRNIEEVELTVGTRVQTINFNNYDSLVAESQIQDPNYVPPTEGEQAPPAENPDATTEDQAADDEAANDGQNEEQQGEEQNEGEQAENETPISTIDSATLPAELKLLTLNIEVNAPDYDALLDFIKELEQLQRVVRVDTISYSLPGEELEYDPEATEIVTATIQVTAFYYEGDQ